MAEGEKEAGRSTNPKVNGATGSSLLVAGIKETKPDP
jgi:hypothetical protein